MSMTKVKEFMSKVSDKIVPDKVSSSTKPEFIFVPGAWHGPESFEPTASLLKKAGYKVHGITLPSVGASPPLKSFDEDAKVIRSKVDSVLSSGKDVVMIYHSYGSAPGAEALSGYLSAKLDDTAGKKDQGNIRRLVYCASFILPEGGSLMAGLNNEPLPWFQINGDEVKAADPATVFYNDLDVKTAETYVAQLKPHSYPTFSSQLTVAPWRTIPSSYILCENDAAIPAPAQEGMIAMAQGMAADSFDVVERCKAGHSPFISQADWLAEVLIKAAS